MMLRYGDGEENAMQQIEHKQRVTIYPLVDAVIREDTMNMEGNDNRNGFILHVIERMMDDPEINLAAAAGAEEDQYKEYLRRIPTENRQIGISGTDELARALADRRIKQIKKKYADEQEQYDRDSTGERYDITLRIKNDLYVKLETKRSNWTEFEQGRRKGTGYEMVPKYYRREKEFIERILWDYACKPANQRERVYCKDRIEMIKEALKEREDKRRSLIVTLRMDGNPDGGYTLHRVAPYGLYTDASGSYYYLVGISERIDDAAEGRKYASFRISRIKNIDPDTHMYVPDSQRQQLQERINRLGVPYILGPVQNDSSADSGNKITVRLTENGWRMYLTILRNRPRYNNVDRPQPDKDGNVILEFDCSERQIENYFYMYGADAYIVQPVSLRERFIQKYTEALQAYASNVDS